MNPLSTAYGQWHRGEDWKVVDKDGTLLFELPAHFKETEVMQVIRTGREYELKAFNEGISFWKREAAKQDNLEIQRLRSQIKTLELMNEDLSNQLERHLES